MTANGPLYPCGDGSSGSNTGSSGSTGNSKAVPNLSGNSDLDNDGRRRYNNYNDEIDDFNASNGDCEDADFAKFWASQQLNEGDATLAEHFNRYIASSCDNTSDLII